MNILSLFDGISCAKMALQKAGLPVETYYASEIDKYALQIAQKNHPDTVQLGDVKEIKAGTPNGIVGLSAIDLLIGGSPCQDLSIAKKDRKGLEGSRSGLFYEYLRILREVQPKYFILENVASMPKEAKEEISKQLGVEPIMINAALVSAQNRKRLFWTNIPNVELPADKGIYLKHIIHENTDGADTQSYIVLDKHGVKEKLKSNTVRVGGRGSGLQSKQNWDTIRIGHLNKGGQADRVYSIEGKSVCLSANGGGRGAKTGLYLIKRAYPVALRNRGQGKKPEYNKTGRANALTTVQTDSMVDVEHEYIRKLTPVECERLQGLPDGYTEGVSNTQRYRGLGNAFHVDVIAHILTHLKTNIYAKRKLESTNRE